MAHPTCSCCSRFSALNEKVDNIDILLLHWPNAKKEKKHSEQLSSVVGRVRGMCVHPRVTRIGGLGTNGEAQRKVV